MLEIPHEISQYILGQNFQVVPLFKIELLETPVSFLKLEAASFRYPSKV